MSSFCKETQSKNVCTIHWAHRSFCTTRGLEGAGALSPQSTISGDGRLMTSLYTIFTQFLRHFYDLPRPMRHTLQRHDGGLVVVRAHQARVRQESPRRLRQHRAQEGSVSKVKIE